ncbi:MAG: tripartite tricarboxylate transporter TctB family protein [Proteobacteria bacterium]|nr:tripartite tricarboxylate transporter TctB family protein [Pseudomonadota bacterium]
MGRLEALGKDVVGGILMIAIGIWVTIQSHQYPAGTMSRMGPGFFPTALGVIMILLGIAITAVGVLARRTKPAVAEKQLPPEWKAWTLISLSIVAFIVFARYGGLIPATFAITFISAFADRDNTWKSALVLALGMCAIAWIVFWWALQLQLPLFQWGA